MTKNERTLATIAESCAGSLSRLLDTVAKYHQITRVTAQAHDPELADAIDALLIDGQELVHVTRQAVGIARRDEVIP